MLNFIDLFAGLSGIRIGFERAAREFGIETNCLLTQVQHRTAIPSTGVA